MSFTLPDLKTSPLDFAERSGRFEYTHGTVSPRFFGVPDNIAEFPRV